ncbi:class I SAM-dependent methyltransferase [Paenibacillus sp. CAU 1782]
MPDHEGIYRDKADQYEALISKQPELLACVNEICPVEGLDIIDMGAGTGRLAVPLAGAARSIVAVDASESMLEITGNKLRQHGLQNWGVMVGDHRWLPLENECSDLIVSGWSVCYLCSSLDPEWRSNLDMVMGEMKRVLRSGGKAILFETMGTGFETPSPPSFLLDYYKALEEDYGFSHKWIRLDYEFDSPEQAEELSRFFFGDELGDKVAKSGQSLLPECAGVWWKSWD